MGFKSVVGNMQSALDDTKDRLRTVDGPNLDIRIASLLFSGSRGHYYQYLADMIEGTRGKISLRDIFIGDADRYGNNPRGKLSAYWASRFEDGGSLEKTFAGTLPYDDVTVLDTLQRLGGEGALETGLRDLASNVALVSKARAMLLTSITAPLFCLAVLIVLSVAMPLYTIPKITAAFSILPADQYPENAQSLFDFGYFVQGYWWACVTAAVAFVSVIMFSLSLVTGKPRDFLDKYGVIWAIYRDFQSIRFISNLATMIRRRGNSSIGLYEAISTQLQGASRWKAYHLNAMLEKIAHGNSGAELFGTGILDKEMYWYICDLISSRGLDDALQFVSSRLEDRVIKKISLQSITLSWTIMMSSLLAAGYLMFWHVTAIDDMVSAMKMYLS